MRRARMAMDENSTSRDNINAAIRAMLLRHGVRPEDFLGCVRAITGITYQSAQRRFELRSAWTHHEVLLLARYFNSAATAVLAHGLYGMDSHDAVWVQGTVSTSCVVWPGEPFRPRVDAAELVALRPRDGHELWQVMASTGIAERECCRIRALVSEPSLRPRRVALLVRPDPWLEQLGALLDEGFVHHDSFTSVDALLQAMTVQAYRGFVVEWSLIEASPHAALGAMRERCALGAIVLLAAPGINDIRLQNCLREFRAGYYEQPYSRLGVANALHQGFRALDASAETEHDDRVAPSTPSHDRATDAVESTARRARAKRAGKHRP